MWFHRSVGSSAQVVSGSHLFIYRGTAFFGLMFEQSIQTQCSSEDHFVVCLDGQVFIWPVSSDK